MKYTEEQIEKYCLEEAVAESEGNAEILRKKLYAARYVKEPEISEEELEELKRTVSKLKESRGKLEVPEGSESPVELRIVGEFVWTDASVLPVSEMDKRIAEVVDYWMKSDFVKAFCDKYGITGKEDVEMLIRIVYRSGWNNGRSHVESFVYDELDKILRENYGRV